MGRPRKSPPIADQIALLDNEIPALEMAIELQEKRLQAAEEELAQPMQLVVAAVLELGAEEYANALQQVRDLLAQLAEPFAHLIAADKVRHAIIGERFIVPKGSGVPFGGLTATRAVISALPSRIKPPELAEIQLFARAHEISSATIAEIEGDQP